MTITLEVLLDNQREEAGRILSGKILLKVVGSPARGGELTLHVAGKEESWVNHIRLKHPLFSEDVVVRDSGKRTLWPGNYEFPFRLKLPDSLPSSMEFQIYQSGFKIHYEVRAQLRKKSHTVPFTVEASPMAASNVSRTWGPSSFNVWSAGLAKLGSLSLSVDAINTHLGRGEHLQLTLACRNRSLLDIKRVEVQLVEHMDWKRDRKSRPLLTLLNADLPGLQKSKADRTQVIFNEMSGKDSPDRQALSDDLRSEQNALRLRVPLSSLDTYEGELVRISHSLEIKLVTKVHSFSARIPVRIGSRPEQNQVCTFYDNMPSDYLHVEAIATAESQHVNQKHLQFPLVHGVPTIEAYPVKDEGRVVDDVQF